MIFYARRMQVVYMCNIAKVGVKITTFALHYGRRCNFILVSLRDWCGHYTSLNQAGPHSSSMLVCRVGDAWTMDGRREERNSESACERARRRRRGKRKRFSPRTHTCYIGIGAYVPSFVWCKIMRGAWGDALTHSPHFCSAILLEKEFLTHFCDFKGNFCAKSVI